MNEVVVTEHSITLQFAVDELETIHQALNEVCNGLTIVDFEARLGVPREDAERLMRQLRESVERARAVPARGR